MAAHGVPRYTADIDLLVNPTPTNAARVVAAINAFGFASLGLTEADFATPGQVVQLGMAPSAVKDDKSADAEADGAEKGRAPAYDAFARAYTGRSLL